MGRYNGHRWCIYGKCHQFIGIKGLHTEKSHSWCKWDDQRLRCTQCLPCRINPQAIWCCGWLLPCFWALICMEHSICMRIFQCHVSTIRLHTKLFHVVISSMEDPYSSAASWIQPPHWFTCKSMWITLWSDLSISSQPIHSYSATCLLYSVGELCKCKTYAMHYPCMNAWFFWEPNYPVTLMFFLGTARLINIPLIY